MNVKIKPGRAKGIVAAPPSKSYAHRLMLCAALANGTSTVRGVAQSQDMLATLDCIAALGAQYHVDGDVVTICGGARDFPDGTVFPCRESGSTLRFFLPLALTGGRSAVFTGSERLIERGVSVYETLFSETKIHLEKAPDRISVRGLLSPGDYALRGNVSSQFVSGLLFALPLLDGDSMLRVLPPVESRPYIDITVDAMRHFGVRVAEAEPNIFLISGGQDYRCADVTVEGDWSNAAALYALNLTGGKVRVTGLNAESLQGDRVCAALLRRLNEPQPVIDLSDCPDLGPMLFAAAAAGHGAVFTGTRRLRIKESDRAAAMAAELEKFGITAEVLENSVRILPRKLKAPAEVLQSHNDHRIVMALSLLAGVTGGEIAGAEAVNKSYPNFFETLSTLGLEVSYGA